MGYMRQGNKRHGNRVMGDMRQSNKRHGNRVMEDMVQGNKRHGNRVIRGSSEIWSDKLKVLYNRHTESRRGRRLCNVTEVPTAQRVTEA